MISRGVVLKRTESGENHQLITFYTREFGKLVGIAKSVKKSTSKQASHLEVFNLVDFRLIAGRTYSIVASAQSAETFSGLKNSLNKLSVGFFLLESFNRLVYDHEQDTALWNFLVSTLRELETSATGELDDDYLGRLKGRLLNVLGYTQDWEKQEADYFLELLSQKRFLSLDFINSMPV